MKKLLLLFCLIPLLSQATLIFPPDNIGQMADHADVVVYGKIIGHLNNNPYQNSFKVLDLIKGDLANTNEIIVDEYSHRIGNMLNKIDGDTDYKIGENYLLFLAQKNNGHYQARLLALSVFMEGKIEGQTVFAHEKAFLGVHMIDNGTDVNGLRGVFQINTLISHLKNVTLNGMLWDENTAGRVYFNTSNAESGTDQQGSGGNTDTPPTAAPCPNTPPSHCTTLFGDPGSLTDMCTANSPGRFAPDSPCGAAPSFEVCLSSSASTDPSNPSAVTDLQNAVATMNGMPGVDISYGGINACAVNTPCGVSAAADACSSTFSSKVWVFLNDPCDEIADFNGCSGTVGFGGSFGFNDFCHEDCCGNMWNTNTTPYFLMNNLPSFASCSNLNNYSYSSTLVHEMLHSIGVGHIGGDQGDPGTGSNQCTAIMNPVGCNANATNGAPDFGVTALDNACTEWMYSVSPALPVELVNFDANLVKDEVALKWTTASEKNNDFFTIERSANYQDWTMMTKVEGAGDSDLSNNYNTLDRNPLPGTSYYRLKQTDFDGQYTYSDVESVKTAVRETIKVIPNPIQANLLSIVNDVNQDGDLDAKIYNINGQLLQSAFFSVVKGRNNLQMNVNDITAGVYLLETIQNGVREIQRFLIAD